MMEPQPDDGFELEAFQVSGPAEHLTDVCRVIDEDVVSGGLRVITCAEAWPVLPRR